MQDKNYTNIRTLNLETSSFKSSLKSFTQENRIFTSGLTIESNLYLKNYDCLVLDIEHPESMEVLKNIKEISEETYTIVCGNEPEKITKALSLGADSILLNPEDEKECERTLHKASAYLNMQEVFNDTYYLDNLTSCPNLCALQNKITLANTNAILKLSLGNFKVYQIYYGVDVTNKILIEFGNAIRLNLPGNAELFRSCEDEFSILLKNPSPSQEDILSKQLKAFFDLTPIEVDGFLLKIKADIGVANGTKLLQKVDIALLEAKEGYSIVHYNEDSIFIKEQSNHIRWVKVIQDALNEDRIEVYYQPIMNNKDNSITKYESLCRIIDEDGTVHMPNNFLPAASIAGRMCDISKVVIDKSFKYFKGKSHSFSINVTREDFLAEYLVDYISYKCDIYNIKPERIYIEVLENISTESANGFLTQILKLRELGCNISIDDFGVDNSNFARMMQIKADVIKIDGHFIQQLLHDENARIIVENIIDFSRKLGSSTVAEYVDSKELQNLVQEMGITYSQGFYIGKPKSEVL